MNFAKLFQKSNSSIHQLQGNVLECTIEQIRGAQLIIETGMRPPFLCSRADLVEPPAISEARSGGLFATDRKARSLGSLHSPDAQFGFTPLRLLADCQQPPVGPSVGARPPVFPLRALPLHLVHPSGEVPKGTLQATSHQGGLAPTLGPKVACNARPVRGNRPVALRAFGGGSLLLASALNYADAPTADRQPLTSICWRTLSKAQSRVVNNAIKARSHHKGVAAIAIIATASFTASSLRERREAALLQAALTCLIGAGAPSNFTGETTCIAPKSLVRSHKRAQLWTELTRLWRSSAKNRVKGFILNSVNGGFAVAVAGYIAFLPKSLCINKKVFLAQWRQFAIIGMNPKIANIVVKECYRTSGAKQRAATKPRLPRRPSDQLAPGALRKRLR